MVNRVSFVRLSPGLVYIKLVGQPQSSIIIIINNNNISNIYVWLDGWIILGWVSRRWDMGIWTGLGWPRIETVGGRL